MALTSIGVKLVPPPRGKSISSLVKLDSVAVSFSFDLLFLSQSANLTFLALWMDEPSSSTRFGIIVWSWVKVQTNFKMSNGRYLLDA